MLKKCVVLTILVSVLYLGSTPASSSAQSITVSVTVTEQTGGLFESRLRSALRRLGDVEIVPWTDTADFRVYAVVVCSPDQQDCHSAESYVSSLRVSKPINPGDILWALHRADTMRGIADLSLPAEGASHRLVEYERTVNQSVAKWGRLRYQQGIDEWVARVDANCFEPYRNLRIVLGLFARGRHEQADALGSELEQQNHWNCLPR